MPYLDLKKDKIQEDKQKVTVPDIRNKTIGDAKKELKELELELEIDSNEEYTSESIIIEQIPKPGIKLVKGAKIMCEI